MNRTQTLAAEACGYALANRFFTVIDEDEFGTETTIDLEDMEVAENGIKALGLDADKVTHNFIEEEAYEMDNFHKYLLDDDFTLADLIGTAN